MDRREHLMSRQTFIRVSEDCRVHGETPPRRDLPSAAEVQHRMLVEEPYRHTQPEILFASSTAARTALDEEARLQAEAEFFGKPQACLRTSPLVRRYGWGIHFDAEGRAAAYSSASEEYERLAADDQLVQTRGMRSKK